MMKRFHDLAGVIRLFRNWHIRVIEFLGLYPWKKIKYRLRNGLIFNVRNNKVDTITIIDSLQKHDYDKYFKIGLKDLVIDIGANLGAFSIYAANIAREGLVCAFEPEEQNFRLLEENVKENGLTNIKTFKLGVSDKKKKSKLFLSEGAGQHSIYLPLKPTGKSIEVKFVSLKQIFKDNEINCCDFLKMDCEGVEYKILLNCPKEILKKIKKIAMEFHNFDSTSNHLQLKRCLEKNGFQVVVSDEKPFDKTGMLYAIMPESDN